MDNVTQGFLGTLNLNIMFIYLPRSAVLWEALHSLGKGESPLHPEEHKIRTAAQGNTHACLEGKIKEMRWFNGLLILEKNIFSLKSVLS